MITQWKKLLEAVQSNELTKNILYLEGETSRFTFFTLFLLRVQLILLFSSLFPSLPVLYIVMFYALYNLFHSRLKNLGLPGKILPVLPALAVTYLLVNLFTAQRFYFLYLPPSVFSHDEAYLNMPLTRAAHYFSITNLISLTAAIPVSLLILCFFSIIKGRPVKNDFTIKPGGVFAGKGLVYNLFSLRGKTSRISYLYATLIAGSLTALMSFLYCLFIVYLSWGNWFTTFGGPALLEVMAEHAGILLSGAAFILLFSFFTFLGITVKRLHHLGQSGFLCLPVLLFSVFYMLFHPLAIQAGGIKVASLFGIKSVMLYSTYGSTLLHYAGTFFTFCYLLFVFYLAFGHGEKEVPQKEPESRGEQPAESEENSTNSGKKE